MDIEEAQLQLIARFLRDKKELRALDVRLWLHEWPSLAPFWDFLKQLPSLEVLGITTGVGEENDGCRLFVRALHLIRIMYLTIGCLV